MRERAHVLKSGVSVFFCTKNLTFCAFTIYCNKVFAIFLFFDIEIFGKNLSIFYIYKNSRKMV